MTGMKAWARAKNEAVRNGYDPRDAIRRAATAQGEAHEKYLQAIAQAYGELPVGQIAEAAGITRPTVYRLLRDAGVQLKGATK
jgi:AcrR family transcriptional regulator